MTPEETRAEITEKIHNIMDRLDDCPDRIIERHCQQILDRLDVLSAMEKGDCE